MAKVEEVMKNKGEERVMTPQEPPKPAVEKDNGKPSNAEPKAEENKTEAKETGKAQDKKEDKKADKDKKSAEKKKEENAKNVEKTENTPTNDPVASQSIAPYAPSNMTYGGTEPSAFAPNDNFDKDNKMSLNVYKKEKVSKTPIRDFIAEVCDMKGYKKGDKKETFMSKKFALANVIWLGAKLTVACTVFGPIAGSWLTAQYTNKDKATKIENKMKDGVKFFMA